MKIEIYAADESLQQWLFPSGTPQYGDRIEKPSGIVLETRMLPGKQFLDSPAIIEFIITNATALGVGVLSSWLYDLIKHGVSKLRIDDQETKLDAAAVEQAVFRALEKTNAPK